MILRRPKLRTLLSLVLILLLMAGAGAGAFRASVASSLDELQLNANQRLDLYASSLESEIGRYAHLPGVLGLSPNIDALLHRPNDPDLRQAANEYLERLSIRTGALAIYIQNRQGRVIAASNWWRPESYVGEDDSFRPYFKEAIIGKAGHFFGVGTSLGEAGYYLSEGYFSNGDALGVAVVKISLAHLEKSWAESKTLAMVTDPNGVVILASEPSWKFTATNPLSTEQKENFYRNLQYNRIQLVPLGLKQIRHLNDNAQIVRLPESADKPLIRLPYPSSYLAQTRQLPHSNWRLTVLSSLAPVYELAFNRAALAGVLTAFVLLGLVLLNERRRRLRDKLMAREALQAAYNQLERKVEERTADLSATNHLLEGEITERIRTEKNLRQAQDELVQAGKLAVIGQLSTGIAHELNQPLAALRTLSGNTVKFLERGDLKTASANLSTINHLVERMGTITGALKSFARKSSSSIGTAELGHAIENALFLLDQRLKRTGVEVVRHSAPDALTAHCDPNRLEQVLVNLFANALDELEGTPKPRIEITCQQNGDSVVIEVRDTGPGLGESVREHLFEPFFTTKPVGVGLGLGLTLSSGIIAEAGGTLKADNHPEGGAVFTLTLPATSKENGHD